MNSINLDTIRVGTTPLGVGDETIVLQAAEDNKIVTGPGVTVSTAFDTLIDKLARETEKNLDKQSRNRLSLATQTLAARAGITNAAQLQALEECDKYLNEISEEKAQLATEEAELQRLNKELEEAKKKAETPAAEGETAVETETGPSVEELEAEAETGPSVEELEAEIAACEGRIGALNASIADNSVKLNAALAKLDDKSTRVLAASVRVASTTRLDYLDCIRELSTDKDDSQLEAIDAFARLLGGDDFEKILLEELGIRA